MDDPQKFDRSAAKAAGYTDAEIDAFLKQPSTTRPAPAAPVAGSFDRTGAKAAGYSDDEINGFLNPPAAPSDDSTLRKLQQLAVHGAQQVMAPGTGGFTDEDLSSAGNMARGAGHMIPGMEKGAAGISALLQKLLPNGYGGNSKPIRENYDRSLADIRGRQSQAEQEDPTLNNLGKVGGVVATGVIAPGTSFARLGGIGNAALTGGLYGGAQGALENDGGASDKAYAAVKGGTIGAGAGGALGGLAALLQHAVPVGTGAGLVARLRGTTADALPMEAGVPGALRALQKSGKTLEDIRNAIPKADPEDFASTLMGHEGGRALGTSVRRGEVPQPVRDALQNRAVQEPVTFAKRIGQMTEQPDIVDPTVFAKGEDAAARPAADDLFGNARTQPDVSSPEVSQVLRELLQTKHGNPVVDFAHTRAVFNGYPSPLERNDGMFSVANLQDMRQALDREAEKAVAKGDSRLAGLLGDKRATVDEVLKNAGGINQQQGDALIAATKTRGQAYGTGSQIIGNGLPQTKTASGIADLVTEAGNPAATQQGAASALQQRILDTKRGADPFSRFANDVQGGESARHAVAFKTPEDFAEALGLKAKGATRMAERNTALNGSQTTANFAADDGAAHDAGQALGVVAHGMMGNVAAAGRGALRVANQQRDKLGRFVAGQTYDATGKVLTMKPNDFLALMAQYAPQVQRAQSGYVAPVGVGASYLSRLLGERN